jgi:hypothetical protein
VKEKIRASNPKNRGVGSRVRASGEQLIKKAAKKLKTLLESRYEQKDTYLVSSDEIGALPRAEK